MEHAAEGLAASGRTELWQSAEALVWSRDHGIELRAFDLPGHAGHYREAASHLRHLIDAAPNEDGAREAIRAAVTAVNSHDSRTETRQLVRTPRAIVGEQDQPGNDRS